MRLLGRGRECLGATGLRFKAHVAWSCCLARELPNSRALRESRRRAGDGEDCTTELEAELGDCTTELEAELGES